MPRFLISFNDGDMVIPEGELESISEASHAVVKDAQDAGVWVFGGCLLTQQATLVSPQGDVQKGAFPETKAVISGFSIIDVPAIDEALAWAARIAESCRCTQEVRVLIDDPLV